MNIVLVGNPNVGKSVIFNAFTGSYVSVSNYPGTTVDISTGTGRFAGRSFSVTDTPGVNSLTVHSEDERVTRDILTKGGIDCVIHVADAKNIRRSLLLALELAELGLPMVLALNMSDEARERGITLDNRKLSAALGIDIIETVAVTGEGMSRLKEAVFKARVPSADIVRTASHGASADEIQALRMRGRLVDALLEEALIGAAPKKKPVSEVIGAMALRPASGIPLLILVLLFMYFFVGRLAAGSGVDFLQNTVFNGYINPAVTALIDRYVPVAFIKELLVGDYGLVTMALTYAFAIIFPIVTAFFLFFGFLEDSGYLPRLTVLSDRIFKTIGLNGRAILPMILGLGCGTMATLTARILDTKKERLMVTLLLALAVPCSAQLGVVMGILGGLSVRAMVLWGGVLISVMAAVGWVAARIIPGTRSPFIQEIPPMRMPQLKNIGVKTLARLKWYLKEAVPLFVLGTFILFVLHKTGALELLEDVVSPVVVNLLNLPREVTQVFIIGFLRRDYGAAGLYAFAKAGALDSIQLIVSLVVITLFVPCIAQFFVTVRERGIKAACLIGGFVFMFALLAGYLLNLALRYVIFTLGIAVL